MAKQIKMNRVKNIYYMLAYAFEKLNGKSYKKLAKEKFDNIAELFAEILILSIPYQIKKGLGKTYIPKVEELSSPRGKIDIDYSIKTQSLLRKKLVCVYDEFSVNSLMNKIIKTSMQNLLSADIKKEQKKKLRQLLLFFCEVETIDLNSVRWNIQYNRNNKTYQMLIYICYLLFKCVLQKQSDGTIKIMDFIDEQNISHLYEKFILKYYQKHFHEIKTNAKKIKWQLDDDNNNMLPEMKSDVMLEYKENILIIDAKYYKKSTIKHYNNLEKWHSSNLYQIFAYVKNKQIEQPKYKVSGMLLYAKTVEENHWQSDYKMSGNQIGARTLDLNKDFFEIKKQLNEIIFDEKYLNFVQAA